MVDLGLPSGLKWAKYNIGAEKETDYGKYFQWGDTVGRTADEIRDKPCSWSTAPFNNGSSSYDSSYFTAHKSEWLDGDVLKPQYDAATQNMGDDYRMPTKADCDELLANTNNEWVTNYNGSGVNGHLFTSKTNGNTLFIPAAGYGLESFMNKVGSRGYVWSSSLDASYPDLARYLGFNGSACDMNGSDRYFGFSLRGVLRK